jgi:hypothetical protein
MVLMHQVVVILRYRRHDVDRSFRNRTYQGVAPTPANIAMDGSATAANAAVATKGPTFQALLTRSTHPEGHKHHCRRSSTVRRAEFYVEPDGVRYHPRTLWETISE